MYSVFLDFYEELEAEVMAQRPKHIFVTGHSLGAGLANMIGLRLQNSLDYTPDRVDVIGFGGPNTGDEAFTEAFRTSVNSRHVIFLGHGREPDRGKYTAGDICAQYTCEAYPGCDVLDTGPSGTWYHYVRPHNQVGDWLSGCGGGGMYVSFISDGRQNGWKAKKTHNPTDAITTPHTYHQNIGAVLPGGATQRPDLAGRGQR